MEKIVYTEQRKTPVGRLFIGVSSKGLAFLSFGSGSERKLIARERKRFGRSAAFQKVSPMGGRTLKDRTKKEGIGKQLALIKEANRQLQRYFSGRSAAFSMRKDLAGLTDFEKQVLKQLDAIPCGRTASYREIAQRVKNPRGARAVGNAVGKNPFAIIVPCHRVIKSDGSIGGFGAPISIKRNLLFHEKKIATGSK